MNSRSNPLAPDDLDWTPPRRVIVDALDAVLAQGLRVSGAATLRACDALGRLASRAGRPDVTPADIRRLFTTMTRDESARVAAGVTAVHFKNRALMASSNRGGLDWLDAWIDVPAAGAWDALLDDPKARVIVTWHVGPYYGARLALRRSARPVLAVPESRLTDPGRRASVFHQAIEHLQRGGMVFTVLDGPGGASTGPLPCLGRRIVFRRGPFALARLTGAPLVPVTQRWMADGRIAVDLDHPLRPGDAGADPYAWEDALAAQAARRLEQFLCEHPSQAWPYLLHNLLDAPTAG